MEPLPTNMELTELSPSLMFLLEPERTPLLPSTLMLTSELHLFGSKDPMPLLEPMHGLPLLALLEMLLLILMPPISSRSPTTETNGLMDTATHGLSDLSVINGPLKLVLTITATPTLQLLDTLIPLLPRTGVML